MKRILLILLATQLLSCGITKEFNQKQSLMILRSDEQPFNKKLFTQKHKGELKKKKHLAHFKRYRKINYKVK